MASNHAVLELPNNFISPTQMIGGCQIPTIRFGVSVAPTEKPDFKGQIYFSKYNGDAFLYIANGNTLDDWEAIYFPNDRGDVFKGKSNNFVDSLQTILNRQITTIHFIDEQTPASIPNFAGQLIVSKYGGKLTLFVAVDGANWSQLSGDGGTMPDVSNFAKLDSANDFKDIQSVKGNAIVTVINGTHADPNGNITPDYPGQLYIYEDETNAVTDYYISDANGGWDMLNEEINTANFVRTNITNNFESAEQTILKNQIVTVIVKAVPPNEQPKFIGQVYLDTSKNDSNVYLAISRSLSPDGANWVCLNTPANMPDEVVREDLTNNFTVQRQQINGNQIASILHGSTPPPAADSQHLGRVYVENDGTNIKAYICVPTGELTYEYKPIIAEIGNEYARKDKVNNFIAVNDLSEKEGQLIHGRPVMCSIVRDDLPNVSNIKPEFKGQIYVYRKKITGSEEYDTALWIADDNPSGSNLQWTPLQRNLNNLYFRKDLENKITWPVQIMQRGDDTNSIEYLMGAKRIKGLPTTLTPSRIGEIVISEIDFTPPTPSVFKIFIALSDKEGDWLKVSDSSVDIVALEERVSTLEGHKDTHATKITTLEGTSSDLSLRMSSQENSLRDAWTEINTQKTVTNPSFDGRIKDINTEVIEISNQLITLEPLKNKSVTNLELDVTHNNLVGKNIVGEVVCELALPSIPNVVPVDSIRLDVSTLDLLVGETKTFATTFEPENATLKIPGYTSDDLDILDVNRATGEVTAKALGTTTLHCHSIQGGAEATCTVNVVASRPLTTLTMCHPTHGMHVNDRLTIDVSATPYNATDLNVVWSYSPNTAGAFDMEVDSSTLGVTLTAKMEGTFTLTATSNGIEATSVITVSAAPIMPVSMTLTAPSNTVSSGQTLEITCNIVPSNTTNKNVTWHSLDETLCTVDENGIVTQKGSGTTGILCISEADSTVRALFVIDCVRTYNEYQYTRALTGTSGVLIRIWGCGDKNLQIPANKHIQKIGAMAKSNSPSSTTSPVLYIFNNENLCIDKISGTWTKENNFFFIDIDKSYNEDVWFMITSFTSANIFERRYGLNSEQNLAVGTFYSTSETGGTLDLGSTIEQNDFNKPETIFAKWYREP